jgi:LysM repeat protein
MKTLTTITAAGTFLLLAGCGTVAMKEDVNTAQSAVDQRVTDLETSMGKRVQAAEQKISQIEKTQSDQQASILGLSEDLKNQTRDLKASIDDTSATQGKNLDAFRKSQDDKNFELRRDVDTLKKSQSDLLTASSSINTTFTSFQNDFLALKTGVQQIAQTVDGLSGKDAARAKDIESVRKDLTDKMQAQIDVLLAELARQESEIAHLKSLVPEPPPAEAGSTTITVVKGDTLEKLARKHNTTVEKLKTLNDLKDGKLVPGQKLLIP